MIPVFRTAKHRKSTLKICRSALLLAALPLLMLASCQSQRLSTGSCIGAAPGSQTAMDCQYGAAITFSRRAGN